MGEKFNLSINNSHGNMSETSTSHVIYHHNLLHIVSSGNALVAEILRLKDYIPDVFVYFELPSG